MSINVSEGFRAYYADGGAPFVSVTYLPSGGSWATIPSSRVCMGGVTVEGATSPVNSFAIGAAIVGTATVALANWDGMFDSWDFEGMQLRPRAVAIVNGSAQYATLGTYDVEPPESLGSVVTLRCRDLMGRFERAYSDVPTAYPATLHDIVSDVCDACGVSMAQASFPNSDYVVAERPAEDLSCIDVISCAAQVACCFARMDEVGRLAFGWYDLSAFGEGGTHRSVTMLRSLEVGVADVTITGVRVTAQDAEPGEDGAPGAVGETALAGAEGYVLPIEGNPLVLNGQAATVAALVAPRVVGLAFRPLDAGVLGDPSVTAGDAVAVTDRLGRTFETYLTNVTWSSGGSQRLACGAATPGRQSGRGRTGLLALAVEQVRRAVRIVEAATAAARAVADEASLVASATDQHFWTDDDGVHVTQVPQDDWRDEQSASHHSGPNLLANSLGMLLRDGLANVASWTGGAVAFFDGLGNSASNVLAYFGRDGSRIGPEVSRHVEIDGDSITMYGSHGNAATTISVSPWSQMVALTAPHDATYPLTFTLPHAIDLAYLNWTGDPQPPSSGPISSWTEPDGRGELWDLDPATGELTLHEFGGEDDGERYAQLSYVTMRPNIASGEYAEATGGDSAAFGEGVVADGCGQVAVGRWNVSPSIDPLDPTSTWPFVVGDGSGPNNRHNALAVDDDGSTHVYGQLLAEGGVVVSGHGSAVGTLVTASDTISVPHNSGTALCSVTIDEGSWLVEGVVEFAASATGVRAANLNIAGGSTNNSITGCRVSAASVGTTDLPVQWATARTAQTTIYLNAFQTSGGALSVTGYIRAMRVA